MQESWNNNIHMVNGWVKPPIVLRSETEMLIAQNAHNLVWERLRGEYDRRETEIKQLEKAGENADELKNKRWEEKVAAKNEIDVLIKAEIADYRAEKSGNPNSDIEERIAELEKKLKSLRGDIDEAKDTAEEAQEAAEEAQEAAEEAKETADEALELAKSLKEDDEDK